MARTERDFCGEFPLSFKMAFPETAHYYHKIRDDGNLQMYDSHLWHAPGKYIGIEMKFNRAKTTINMAKLFEGRMHQIRNLLQRIEMGHRGWICINWFLLSPKTNRCFILHPGTAEYYINKGTVKMDDFIADKSVVEVERKKNLGRFYWDFNSII